MGHAFLFYIRNICSIQGHKDFSLTFSFVSFIDFAFTLKLNDSCKLILCMVQGVDWCFFIFAYGYPVVPVPLSFLFWITFLSSWKIYWLYVRGSISGFSVLFLWTICVFLSISTKWSGLSLLSSKVWYQIVGTSKFILLFRWGNILKKREKMT